MSKTKRAGRIRIRDRRPGYHWALHEVIDIYGQPLGPYGLAIYYALCRHANDQHQAWPSYGRLARETGMGRKKAVEMIALIEELGLIEKESRETEQGDKDVNLYYLLDIPKSSSGWHESNGVVSDGHQVVSGGQHPVVSHRHQGGVPGIQEGKPIKDNHIEGEGAKRPPPSTQCKERPRDPQLDHPACQIYRHFAELTPKKGARPLLIDTYEKVGESAFHRGVEEWMANWSPHNVTGLCDRIVKEWKGEADRRLPGKRTVSQAQREYYASHLDPKD